MKTKLFCIAILFYASLVSAENANGRYSGSTITLAEDEEID